MDLAQGISQGAVGPGAGYGSGGALEDGIAQKGEALLALLADLDITYESYTQYLQTLLMDVSVPANRLRLCIFCMSEHLIRRHTAVVRCLTSALCLVDSCK